MLKVALNARRRQARLQRTFRVDQRMALEIEAEKKAAIEAWAARLHQIAEGGEAPTNVIELPARAG